MRRFIDESDANETFKTVQHAKLDRMWEYASAYECRTNVILNYFGEYRTHLCGHCDNCTLPPKKIDGTIIAQKALSAIRRCDENIGLNLLIDILRGSFKSEVKKGNYDKIKTFGAGKDISYIHWKIYLTQLINQGLIRIDYTDQFKLKTTPLSHDILFGDNAIQLVNVDIPTTTASQIQKPISKKMDFKVVLVQRLKKWREEEADKRQVPSYTLITGTTLEILGDKKPIFKSDLHEISGMGEVKIQQFGQAILTVIRQMYLSEEFTKLKAGKSIIETAQMLYEGLTPEEIAHKKGVTTNTIWTHIVELIRHDEDIDIHIYVSKEEINIVHKAWEVSNKATTMSEIIACMSEPMAYHKVRLAMTYIFKSQNN